MEENEQYNPQEETEELPMEQRTPAPSAAPHQGYVHEERPHAHAVGNVVYVSKKGVMAYVLAVVTQFNAGANEVTVKARGKVISRAVDTAEIVRNKFLHDVTIKSIRTSTEDMISAGGSPTKVSTIEIVMTRTPGAENKELRL
ncbi:DNA/RNA-binding protein Alba [uncultured archaeon]|nr:DNA/RNA-binding protein Alba [uncultured archaeon]